MLIVSISILCAGAVVGAPATPNADVDAAADAFARELGMADDGNAPADRAGQVGDDEDIFAEMERLEEAAELRREPGADPDANAAAEAGPAGTPPLAPSTPVRLSKPTNDHPPPAGTRRTPAGLGTHDPDSIADILGDPYPASTAAATGEASAALLATIPESTTPIAPGAVAILLWSVGAAGLTAGTVLVITADQHAARAEARVIGSQIDAKEAQDRALAAQVAFAAGGACVAAGFVAWLVEIGLADDDVVVVPTGPANSAGLSLSMEL